MKNVKYILKLITKNITHDLLTINFCFVNKLVTISKKKNVATIDKNVENSLLRTVLNEKPNSGFFQFLKQGITIGVF